MGADSKIQWTHHTFNPWRGCTKVHAGCTNCYAEKAMPNVMRKGGPLKWGEAWQGGERVVSADAMWKEPLRWARAAASAGERRRVFCASLADVLEVPSDPPSSLEDLEPAAARARAARDLLHHARERLWDTIRETAAPGFPEHEEDREDPRLVGYPSGPPPAPGGLDWLLLTKRPENWRMVPEDVRPLVWLGTSISDQETADEWVPRLLEADGFRYRFVSAEPLVGPVDLRTIWRPRGFIKPLTGERIASSSHGAVVSQAFGSKIDWVIVGGESGKKARSCDVDWIRSVVRQSRDAGVPCFVKQLGAAPRFEIRSPTGNGFRLPVLTDAKGGDWNEWPEDLRVRQFPGGGHA